MGGRAEEAGLAGGQGLRGSICCGGRRRLQQLGNDGIEVVAEIVQFAWIGWIVVCMDWQGREGDGRMDAHAAADATPAE